MSQRALGAKLLPFLSNPGFLAVAFMEGSAAFIILVLYWLLSGGFPARFFRVWLAGWAVYTGIVVGRVVSLWRGGSNNPRFVPELSLIAAAIFFTAIVECVGQAKRLKYLWPLAILPASSIAALPFARLHDAARWGESLSECTLYVAAGWILWRWNSKCRSIGWRLLAGTLLLRGLHGLDRPEWTDQSLGLFSVSFQGFFGIAMGIAMVVFVLEAGRERTEELNEKLRRLALITAEATHSLRLDETLEGALRHLTGSLGASHGLVYLFSELSGSADLILRASVGFNDDYRKTYARLSPSEPWAQKVLQQANPLVLGAGRDGADPEICGWMDAAQLTAMVLVRVPGEKEPLGLLGIGSSANRTFESDEEHFLVNVANLLGLTVQNLTLFETTLASRRQWTDTFDSIDDLIFVHSPDGRISRMNRAFSSRLQAQPAALKGRFVRDVLRQGDPPWDRCPYCEGVAGKAQTPDPSFDGYFLATNSVFHDSEGGNEGTIHVLKDFTTRRQAENRFRSLFENALEGVFTCAPDGRLLDFNNAFLRILGRNHRSDLLGENIAAVCVDPSDRARLKRLLNQYGEVAAFQFQFRRGDDEIRTAHESGFVTREDAGNIVAYQGFLLDITDLIRAEQDVRQRNRELVALNDIGAHLSQSSTLQQGLAGALAEVRDLFSADVAAVHFLDESTRILRPSVAVGRHSDFAQSIAPGEVSAELLDGLRQSRATLLAGSDPVLPDTLRLLQHHEGLKASQISILWSKDRIIGTLLIGCRQPRDFSPAEMNLLAAVGNQTAATVDKSQLFDETREAYDNLRRTQEQLLQSEKMAAVGQLISGVAHELNNPLTAILGYSQLLKSDSSPDERTADYVEKLYKQAQRTHHIVQSLLSFARQHKPERTAVDVNQILDDTLILREYDMKLNNIAVHREFDPRIPLTAGDFHQLQQVFLNVLNNAVDAMHDASRPGAIWIRTRAADNKLRIEITDNGPGVKNAHRIFDPFYTTKPVGKGTGLGLSICYGIVKEHGGEIQVHNAPPRGACFAVVLPILPVSSLAHSGDAQRAPATAAGKVLLVDDEDAVLQLESEILAARGVSVTTAHGGREAVAILTRESFDAAVMDMKMPGDLSTPAVFSWLEQNRPELAPRVIFTASDPREAEATGILRKSGCPLLAKPFKIEEFWDAVHKVLTSELPAVLPPR